MSAFTNRSQLRIAAFFLLAFVVAWISPGWRARAAAQGTAPEPAKAKAPYIDGHVHLDDRGPAGVQSMLATISREGVKKVFVLVPPYTADDPENYDTEPLLAIAKQHPDKMAVVGGGGTLNAMLQQSMTSGDAGPEMQRKFKARAEELVKLGVIGFGEITTEHFPSPGSSTYQYAPADHPLMLLLADIAAAHNMPIVLHTEAVPQDMPLPAPLKSPPNPAAAACEYRRARTPRGAQSARQNYLGARRFGQHRLPHAGNLPRHAAGSSERVHGDQDRSRQPRQESSGRKRQDQARMA